MRRLKVLLSVSALATLSALTVLAIVMTVGCGNNTGVTASIDLSNIHFNANSGSFVIPVTVTPRGIPSTNSTWDVELKSRDGYLYTPSFIPAYVGWAQGATPTPKTVTFYISSDDGSASHVYSQLYTDYQAHGDPNIFRRDVTNLLKPTAILLGEYKS